MSCKKKLEEERVSFSQTLLTIITLKNKKIAELEDELKNLNNTIELNSVRYTQENLALERDHQARLNIIKNSHGNELVRTIKEQQTICKDELKKQTDQKRNERVSNMNEANKIETHKPDHQECMTVNEKTKFDDIIKIKDDRIAVLERDLDSINPEKIKITSEGDLQEDKESKEELKNNRDPKSNIEDQDELSRTKDDEIEKLTKDNNNAIEQLKNEHKNELEMQKLRIIKEQNELSKKKDDEIERLKNELEKQNLRLLDITNGGINGKIIHLNNLFAKDEMFKTSLEIDLNNYVSQFDTKKKREEYLTQFYKWSSFKMFNTIKATTISSSHEKFCDTNKYTADNFIGAVFIFSISFQIGLSDNILY